MNRQLKKNRVTVPVMLRTARIVVELVAGVVITVAAAGCASFLPGFAAWLERIQIFPAVMGFAMVTFVSWLLITLLFGRVYCSTVCPLGLLQDVVARVPRLTAKSRARHRYAYRRPVSRLQYLVLTLTLVGMMAGLSFVAQLLDPFTVYVGIVKNVGHTAVEAAEAGLSPLGHATGWWSLTAHDRIIACSLSAFAVDAVVLVLVAVSAALSGRTLCNSICPVGTTLGFVSRYAVMQVDIDTDKCIHCGKCEDVCKASCIDLHDCTVDGSRCVDCFDCLAVCPNDAIHYTGRRHQLSDVLMQRVGGARRTTGQATPTAMNTPNHISKQ